jgi:hypothetical protein
VKNAIGDAHLAAIAIAIAISRGATLASFDTDFAAFAAHGLRWERLISFRARALKFALDSTSYSVEIARQRVTRRPP